MDYTPTKAALKAFFAQQKRVALLCYHCGALGKVYHGRVLLCVSCWIERHGGNDATS